MSDQEHQRELIIETVEAVVQAWVDTAYKTACAGFGETDGRALEALKQMRHLHLAEPWLPAVKVANVLAPRPGDQRAEGVGRG